MDEQASSSSSSSASPLLTIACRLIPHDQWLLTHVDPSWKTKQLKLWLLSKCFTSNLPVVDLPRSRRPPSPITFAPDPRHRPISPITFASASPAPRTTNSVDGSDDTDVDSTWGSPAPSEDEEGVTPLFEPRLRPRTHLYSPPSTRTLQQSDNAPLSFSHNPTTAAAPPPSNEQKRIIPQRRDSLDNVGESYTLIRFSTGQTLEDDFNVSWYNIYPYELLEIHRNGLIVSLPRELSLYIRPYFEAKVMALRVVWQRPSRQGTEEVTKRRTTRLEWRERWVVIKDGNLNLCRRLTDTTPSHHLPLKDLLALRGAAQLEKTLSVAEEQRIICIKFRVDAPQDKTRSRSNQPTVPPMVIEQVPTSPYSATKHSTGSSYAYAFAGGSSRKLKNPGKLKKNDSLSFSSSKATLLPEQQTPNSMKSFANTPSPPSHSQTSFASMSDDTPSKAGPSGNLRLPRIKTTSAPKNTKPMRTAATLRKPQDNQRTLPNKPGSWKQGGDSDGTPPLEYAPPDAPDNTFSSSELDKILNIGKPIDSNIQEEEEDDDDMDNLSTLSSPVFAAPPSPLYAPPSSQLNSMDFDEDGEQDEQDEQAMGPDGDIDADNVSEPPWGLAEDRTTDNMEHEQASVYREERSILPNIQPSNSAPEAGEWVVLDMVEDDAFHSILRILHRHFPSPISSSFINPQTMTMMDTPVETPTSPVKDPASATMDSQTEEIVWDDTSSRKSSVLTSSSLPNSPLSTSNSYLRDTPRRTRSQSPGTHPESLKFSFSSSGRNSDSLGRYPNRTTRLAPVPYPEWRANIVRHARTAGLGSVGKALEYVQKQAEASSPPQQPQVPGKRAVKQIRKPRRRARRDDDNLAIDGGIPSLDYHFGASDRDEDDIIASPLSQKRRPRSACSALDDGQDYGEDDEGSQLDHSEVEWRGWQRDIPRQVSIRQGRVRGERYPASRGSVSSDGEQESRDTHISAEKAFSANPLRRQRDRIALEPSAQVISLPALNTASSSNNNAATVRPLPSPPLTSISAVQSPSASMAGIVAAGLPLGTPPVVKPDHQHQHQQLRSASVIPHPPSVVDTTPPAAHTTRPIPQNGSDSYARSGSSNLTPLPTPFTPAYNGPFVAWRSDMGVRVRVQESSHRKRETVQQPLPTGRLAFRSHSFVPPSPQHGFTTPLMANDVSPPPMVRVSPPSVCSQPGVLPSNKLSHGPSISRRSSPSGYPPELKRKISTGKSFLGKGASEGDLEARHPDSDRGTEASSSSSPHDFGRDRPGQERQDLGMDHHGQSSRPGRRVEDSPMFSPDLSSKKQRPKLSLSTSQSFVGSSPSKARVPNPAPPKTNLLRHTKSKSKELINAPNSPPPSSARIDAPHPATQEKAARKKRFVSLGADKLLTGFEPALDFVGGR